MLFLPCSGHPGMQRKQLYNISLENWSQCPFNIKLDKDCEQWQFHVFCNKSFHFTSKNCAGIARKVALWLSETKGSQIQFLCEEYLHQKGYFLVTELWLQDKVSGGSWALFDLAKFHGASVKINACY